MFAMAPFCFISMRPVFFLTGEEFDGWMDGWCLAVVVKTGSSSSPLSNGFVYADLLGLLFLVEVDEAAAISFDFSTGLADSRFCEVDFFMVFSELALLFISLLAEVDS
jgi:hypothetical protein